MQCPLIIFSLLHALFNQSIVHTQSVTRMLFLQTLHASTWPFLLGSAFTVTKAGVSPDIYRRKGLVSLHFTCQGRVGN